jgi:hypothetical protein
MANLTVRTLLVASAVSGCASAQSMRAASRSAETAPLASAADVSLRPGAGRVPLEINVTEPRRVFLHAADGAGAASHSSAPLRYVCTTPCRLYVHPGPISVTLVGWSRQGYEWDVPAHGGSVSLVARRPDGSLTAWAPEDPADAPARCPMRRASTGARGRAVHPGHG